MHVENSLDEQVDNCDLLTPPNDLFCDLETILLVLMIDFHNIACQGVILKDGLIAHSQSALDQKGRAASRIAAEHFERLLNLAAELPPTYNPDINAEPECQSFHTGSLKGLTITDLLSIIVFISEDPEQSVVKYFPGLDFPCG